MLISIFQATRHTSHMKQNFVLKRKQDIKGKISSDKIMLLQFTSSTIACDWEGNQNINSLNIVNRGMARHHINTEMEKKLLKRCRLLQYFHHHHISQVTKLSHVFPQPITIHIPRNAQDLKTRSNIHFFFIDKRYMHLYS